MGVDALSGEELAALVERVFEPRSEDRALAVLIDLPEDEADDTAPWHRRRELAAAWVRALLAERRLHNLDVSLFAYRRAPSNNADLPPTAWRIDPEAPTVTADRLREKTLLPLEEVLARHQLVLAPTQLSATAPLKVLARRLGFRAATMPGFSEAMIPALRLDYVEVERRVRLLAGLLDRAQAADLEFVVDATTRFALHLDLRHRTAHVSGGLLREPGVAGNLPSGEAFIVPYEGEVEGDPTTSAGELPIQLGDEVVVHRVEANRVATVEGVGENARRQAVRLAQEPAAGNVAELGLGVLAGFGVRPVGSVLLDEKLGLHVALGRSEHFGGQVGPAAFSRPENVVHQDYVYLKELQPRVEVELVSLALADDGPVELMRDGDYVVDFAV